MENPSEVQSFYFQIDDASKISESKNYRNIVKWVKRFKCKLASF